MFGLGNLGGLLSRGGGMGGMVGRGGMNMLRGMGGGMTRLPGGMPGMGGGMPGMNNMGGGFMDALTRSFGARRYRTGGGFGGGISQGTGFAGVQNRQPTAMVEPVTPQSPQGY